MARIINYIYNIINIIQRGKQIMEIDVKDIIAHNLKLARKRINISLEYLASQIGVAKSTLSNFENRKSTPSVEVLFDICNFFQINMSIFVSEYLAENDFFSLDNSYFDKSENKKDKLIMYKKYLGTYNIYYFKTESKITTAKLVINTFKNRFTVDAVFDSKVFEGHLSIVGRHTYVNLTGTTHFEKVLIILHDPPSLDEYIGGIGVMASVSSGRIQNPCAKKLILSKKELSDINELKNLLIMSEKFIVNIDESCDDKVYHMIKQT